MKYDDILKDLGEFGTYQKRLYVLLCIPMVSLGIQIMVTVFTLGVPDHRCAVPGLDNDTYLIQGEQHARAVNAAIPAADEGTQLYSSCHVYDVTNKSRTGALQSSNTTHSCNRWVYDEETFGSNIVTTFDWVCDMKLYKSHIQMMFMLGSLVGSIVVIPPADFIGRKKMFMLGVLFHIAASISMAFATNFSVFTFLMFFNGMSSTAIWMNGFVVGVELVGPSKRRWTGIIVEFFWSSGYFIAVGAAYFIRDWQHLQLVVAAPTVLFLAYYWFIPESPRWLITKRKYEMAEGILQRAAKVNKVTLSSDLFSGNVLDSTKSEPIWKIFTSLTLVSRCVIVFINWLVCSLGYYGLGLNVASLGGSVYANGLIAGTTEVVSYIACILLLDRTGRRSLHCVCMILGGICCTATIFPVLYGAGALNWLTIALALVGRAFVSASFAIVWLYTSELFPTVIRNSTMSVANVCGRLGGVISPYIANLALVIPGDFGRAVPLIIFGASMVGAGLLALLLPETLNKELPESIEDAEKMKSPNQTSDARFVDFVRPGKDDETFHLRAVCDSESEDDPAV
ncbi:organic cation transporter protein-like [Haliotis rubra]|uniref:organic cation transporter protein-like n=1 Tax=Haliotis rubra TaxID=36100 RepID=UPI001EE5D099|nr:organic cation transporter protein-like [Haliotis rubra]